MMQSNTTWITNIYDLSASAMGTTVGVPAEPVFKLFYVYNAYYTLQSTGLLKFTYNTFTRTLTASLKTSNLPSNTYDLQLGEPVNPFFVPGFPYIYKSGKCSGQSANVGGVCVSYNCSTANCAFCPISSLVCSNCSTGFTLDTNYSCQITNTTTNTTNTTTNTTTANTTNTTANTTQTNTTNSTNASNSSNNASNVNGTANNI